MRHALVIVSLLFALLWLSCKTAEERGREHLRELTNKSVVTPEQARHIIDSVSQADSISRKR